MGRRACTLCRRPTNPVASCATCTRAVCNGHVVWDPDINDWICTKCERNKGT